MHRSFPPRITLYARLLHTLLLPSPPVVGFAGKTLPITSSSAKTGPTSFRIHKSGEHRTARPQNRRDTSLASFPLFAFFVLRLETCNSWRGVQVSGSLRGDASFVPPRNTSSASAEAESSGVDEVRTKVIPRLSECSRTKARSPPEPAASCQRATRQVHFHGSRLQLHYSSET